MGTRIDQYNPRSERLMQQLRRVEDHPRRHVRRLQKQGDQFRCGSVVGARDQDHEP